MAISAMYPGISRVFTQNPPTQTTPQTDQAQQTTQTSEDIPQEDLPALISATQTSTTPTTSYLPPSEQNYSRVAPKRSTRRCASCGGKRRKK